MEGVTIIIIVDVILNLQQNLFSYHIAFRKKSHEKYTKMATTDLRVYDDSGRNEKTPREYQVICHLIGDYFYSRLNSHPPPILMICLKGLLQLIL